MTEPEINEAIARKLGWKIHDCERLTIGHWHHPNNDHCVSMLPLFINDIKAAWEIMEWLREGFVSSKLLAFSEAHEPAKRRYYFEFKVNAQFYYSHGETAPMAICLAFLKLP